MIELHSDSKKEIEQKYSKHKVNLNVCKTLTSLSAWNAIISIIAIIFVLFNFMYILMYITSVPNILIN